MKSNYIIIIAASLFLIGCHSEPTLQKYFVDSIENKNFISLDVSPSILKIDKSRLSLQQQQAFQSFEKVNILAFKRNDSNGKAFGAEREKVSKILKQEKYQQLMKFGSGKQGASVSFVGNDEHIDEFVLFANKDENGFAVVRILGKDMNPTGILTMMSALKDSGANLEQLKPMLQLLENKK